MNLKNLRSAVLVLTSLVALSSHAVVGGVSEEVSTGAASIAASPLASIEGGPLVGSTFFVTGSAFIVVGTSVAAGDAVQVVIQNTVTGSKAVFQTAASVARDVGVSVGTGIKVVAESTGYALIASGKILAFVPNAVGQELLYQSKLSQ